MRAFRRLMWISGVLSIALAALPPLAQGGGWSQISSGNPPPRDDCEHRDRHGHCRDADGDRSDDDRSRSDSSSQGNDGDSRDRHPR